MTDDSDDLAGHRRPLDTCGPRQINADARTHRRAVERVLSSLDPDVAADPAVEYACSVLTATELTAYANRSASSPWETAIREALVLQVAGVLPASRPPAALRQVLHDAGVGTQMEYLVRSCVWPALSPADQVYLLDGQPRLRHAPMAAAALNAARALLGLPALDAVPARPARPKRTPSRRRPKPAPPAPAAWVDEPAPDGTLDLRPLARRLASADVPTIAAFIRSNAWADLPGPVRGYLTLAVPRVRLTLTAMHAIAQADAGVTGTCQ